MISRRLFIQGTFASSTIFAGSRVNASCVRPFPLRASCRSIHLTLQHQYDGSLQFQSQVPEEPRQLIRHEIVERVFGAGTYATLTQPDHWKMIDSGWFGRHELVTPDFPDNSYRTWFFHYSPSGEALRVFERLAASCMDLAPLGVELEAESGDRQMGAYLVHPALLDDLVAAVEARTSMVKISRNVRWLEGCDDVNLYPRYKPGPGFTVSVKKW